MPQINQPNQIPNKLKALNVYQLDGLLISYLDKVLLVKQDGYEIDVVDMITDEQQSADVVKNLLAYLMKQ
jgi:hypothetical protein